ncbi:MAG: HIT family hydrolase [Omnitrophica WOR_2 bacterium RIFCSPHIGHO2_01_FULL_48_9]|nr:MAG: HIT family hydrolase [Omnitrophica WOR_2 bacterium RIFCSPHIGHO2_02_FULL_48_11]OGX34552.1 MAG: HIT family hydrolase [Omnitrophica WOR_2 bacterium RIFCSPHIGHO2_01_FULL_48_9]
MASLFTRIVKGEIPCHKILENEKYLAFLDIRPINPGHTLVITKKEIDYIFDVEDELLSGLMVFAKQVAKMIQKEVPCKKVGIMVAGLEVPHVHIHLVPIFDVHDLNFAKAQPTPPEELAKVAEKIRSHAKEAKV